jgi:hypothetical protein
MRQFVQLALALGLTSFGAFGQKNKQMPVVYFVSFSPGCLLLTRYTRYFSVAWQGWQLLPFLCVPWRLSFLFSGLPW